MDVIAPFRKISRQETLIPILIAAGGDLQKQNNEGKRPWDLFAIDSK